MKILLSQGFGGFISTDEFADELQKRFGTRNIYQVRTNADAIALVEEWASKGKKPFSGGFMVEELDKGEKYFIDDDEGYETLLTPDNIQWEVAE